MAAITVDTAINSKFNSQTYRHIGWAIDDATKIIDNRRKGLEKSLLVSQTKLNESLLKGIPWNRIITVAGKSGSGKTTIVEQWKNDLVLLNDDQPLEVLTFEYEMLASDQVIRSLSSKLHKTGAYLQSADDNVITDNEMETIKKIGNNMRKMPIWYVDVPGTVEEMRNTILTFAKEHKLKEQDKGLIITVDYITLTKGRQSDTEKKIVDDLYKMFMEIKKLFASEGIKVLIIAISQLNRDIDSAERKDPKLHFPTQNDIFAASSVYHNSDYVLISHNPSTIEGINWYGLPKGEKYPYGLPLFCPKTKRAMIYWHLIKNRFGKTRIMMMVEKFADSKIEDYVEESK